MLTVLSMMAKFSSMAAKKGPRPLVLCGPSGSGKSTLLRMLFKEFPDTFGFSVSHTTRKPRRGEKDGVDYHFVQRIEMEQAIDNGEFIENACFGGNLYGTSKMAVRNVQSKGKICILDIEMQGVEQIKKTDLNPILIFNNPPSIYELEVRLRKRNTENEEALATRLAAAKEEIEYGLTPGNFHIIINNIVKEVAYKEFRDFIVSEIEKQQKEGVDINF